MQLEVRHRYHLLEFHGSSVSKAGRYGLSSKIGNVAKYLLKPLGFDRESSEGLESTQDRNPSQPLVQLREADATRPQRLAYV